MLCNYSDFDDVHSAGEAHNSEMDDSDRCNLIVNYLPHEIDDGILKVLFSQHGDIVMAKVIKDKVTKRSLGYGFVKYSNEESAAEAIAKKGGMILGRKQLKVTYARPSCDEIKNCKLYVTNLPRDYSEREVMALFQQFGDIIECRVLKQTNAPGYKGVAFVQYDLREQAERALTLNGYVIPNQNRPINVKLAENQHKKKDRRSPPNVPRVLNTMYGMPPQAGAREGPMKMEGSAPYYYQQPQLSPMYTNALSASLPIVSNSVNNSVYYPGNIPSYSSMKSGMPASDPSMNENWYGQMPPMTYMAAQQQGMPYGAHNSAPQAFESMSVDVMGSSPSHVPGYPSSSPREVNNGAISLVISNLPAYADLAFLHKLFSSYGRVLSAQIEMNPASAPNQAAVKNGPRSGACAGRGRVQMASMAEAQVAIRALDGAVVEGCPAPLQVTIAYGTVPNRKV